MQKTFKKVGGKIIQDQDGNYYVEFTKIDDPLVKVLKWKIKKRKRI